jgi:S1-C subfamily serine protease
VKAADVIAAIDDRPVSEITTELAAKVLTTEHVAAGQTVRLKITRGSTPMDLAVTADPVPEGP